MVEPGVPLANVGAEVVNMGDVVDVFTVGIDNVGKEVFTPGVATNVGVGVTATKPGVGFEVTNIDGSLMGTPTKLFATFGPVDPIVGTFVRITSGVLGGAWV